MEIDSYFNMPSKETKTVYHLENDQHHQDDLRNPSIDLNEQLIANKHATFLMRVNGDAMIDAGIADGDMIIVDRTLKVTNGKIVIAMLNGEMLIRTFEKSFNKIRLVPATTRLAPIDIDLSGAEFSIWGIVTYVIRQL